MKEYKFSLKEGRIIPNSRRLFTTKNLVASIFILVIFICQPLICQADEKSSSLTKVVSGADQHPPQLLKLAEEFRAMRGRYSRRWHPGWAAYGAGNAPRNAITQLLFKNKKKCSQSFVPIWIHSI